MDGLDGLNLDQMLDSIIQFVENIIFFKTQYKIKDLKTNTYSKLKLDMKSIVRPYIFSKGQRFNIPVFLFSFQKTEILHISNWIC